MRFVPVTRDELPVSGRPTSRSASLFKEFLESDTEIMEIELDPEAGDKTPESVRSSLDNYVTRHDLPIKVFTRAGRLFIEQSDTKPSERPKRPRKAKGEAESNGEVTDAADVEVDETEVDTEYAGI